MNASWFTRQACTYHNLPINHNSHLTTELAILWVIVNCEVTVGYCSLDVHHVKNIPKTIICWLHFDDYSSELSVIIRADCYKLKAWQWQQTSSVGSGSRHEVCSLLSDPPDALSKEKHPYRYSMGMISCSHVTYAPVYLHPNKDLPDTSREGKFWRLSKIKSEINTGISYPSTFLQLNKCGIKRFF